MHKNGWDVADVVRGSTRCPWVFISKRKTDYLSKTKLIVGNGQRVRFWGDCWIREAALCDLFPRLYSLSQGRECSIASLFKYSVMQWSWDFKFLRNLNDRESEQCAEMLGILRGSERG